MLKSFSRKLLVAVLAASLLLGMSGIFILYRQFSDVTELDVLDSYRKAIEQAAVNLNDRMSFYDQTLQSLLFDTRMQRSLTRKPDEETLENQLKEIQDLRDLVYYIQNSRNVRQVRAYLNSQKMITHEGINFFSWDQALETAEYAELSGAGGTSTWMGTHRVKTVYFDETCITLGCLYRSIYLPAHYNWGMLLLDLPVDHFEEVLAPFHHPEEDGLIAVTNARGEVMFGWGAEPVLNAVLGTQSMASIGSADQWGFCTVPGDTEYAFIVHPLASAGWSIVFGMPRAYLLNSHSSMRSVLTLLLFGLILFMFAAIGVAVTLLYAHSVNRYIEALNASLLSSATPPPISTPHSRALFHLDRNIAGLLETIKRLTEENYRAQLREREVSLQALQAQINPHFLYNTLDSINWMAIRDDAQDVSEAITTLAEYFRLSLSRGKSIVTLREDVEIVRRYLALYERRYDFHYQVLWQLHEDTLACMLPKLTLQPLIENALLHGIFKRSEKEGGMIRITSALSDGQMILTVEDNGPGAPSAEGLTFGYGLRNVRERLDLYFDNRYALETHNLPTGGMQVRIRVAVQHETPQKKEGRAS